MACNQRDFRKDKPTRRGSLCGLATACYAKTRAKPRQKPLRVRRDGWQPQAQLGDGWLLFM